MSDTEVLDAPIEAVEPETPTTETTDAPEAAPDEAASITSERPRGPDGKFIAKEKTEDVGTEDTLANISPLTADNAADNASLPVTTPVVEPEPTPEPTPFAVHVRGQSYPVHGATVQADGSLVVTPEGAQQLHHVLGRAQILHQRDAEINQQRTELRSKVAAADAGKAIYAREFGKLEASQSQEEFIERAAEMWLNRDVIKKEIELAERMATLTTQQEPPQVSQDDVIEAVDKDLRDTMLEEVGPLQGESWAKALTRDDWREIGRDLWAVRASFVVTNEQGYAYKLGAAKQYAERQARRIVAERERASANARQAQTALKKNAAAGVTAVTVPPTVGTGSSPAGKPAAAKQQEPPKPLTYEEKRARRQADLRELEDWTYNGDK